MKTGSSFCVISMLVGQHLPTVPQKKFVLCEVVVASWALYEEKKGEDNIDLAYDIEIVDGRMRNDNKLLMTT